MISAMKQRIVNALTISGLKKPVRWTWKALEARGWTPWKPLVPEADFSECVAQAIAKLRQLEPGQKFGEYLEFGVSRGTSMACVYHELCRAGLTDTPISGFDSFQGVPAEATEQGWPEGDFHSTIGATRSYLKKRGVDLDRVSLVEGWYKDTLTEATRQRLAIEKASLIMIDCDIYTASRDALAFCAPHIRKHAVIMFDDWGWRADIGEIGQKEAFESSWWRTRISRLSP